MVKKVLERTGSEFKESIDEALIEEVRSMCCYLASCSESLYFSRRLAQANALLQLLVQYQKRALT